MNRISSFYLSREFTRAMVAAGFGKPKPDIPDGDNFTVVDWPPAVPHEIEYVRRCETPEAERYSHGYECECERCRNCLPDENCESTRKDCLQVDDVPPVTDVEARPVTALLVLVLVLVLVAVAAIVVLE